MLPSQYRDGPYRPASTVDDPTVPAGDHGTVPAGQYGQSSQTVPAGRHGQKADRTGFDPPTVPSGRTDSMYLNEEEGSLATALPAGALASPRKEEAPLKKNPRSLPGSGKS